MRTRFATTLTITELPNPPTGIPKQFGIFEGSFGCRIFYSKTAGRKILEDRTLELSPKDTRRLLKELEESGLAETLPGLDDVVGNSPPQNYPM